MNFRYFTTTRLHIKVSVDYISFISRCFRVSTMSKGKMTSYYKPAPSQGDTKSESGKSIKKKEEFIFFFGQNYVFSQFHKVDFTVDGEEYCCMEQYMHHQKALTFKDMKTAREIMLTTEPKLHKKLGRQVTSFDPKKWATESVEVVRKGNIEKFSQNKRYREIMFSTYPKTLVEASPRDKVWGIGLGKNNEKAKDRSQWRGKNLLGQTLTEVRDTLMKKFDVDPEAAANLPELDIYIKTKSSSPRKMPRKSVTPEKYQRKKADSSSKKVITDTKIYTSEKSTPIKDKKTPSKSSSSKKRKETSDDIKNSPSKKRKIDFDKD
ncbi:hypothetical protein ACF0H5_004974 [Mactra antiquata]